MRTRRKNSDLIERNMRIIKRRQTTKDTLRQIATDEGLSYERVRQIVASHKDAPPVGLDKDTDIL